MRGLVIGLTLATLASAATASPHDEALPLASYVGQARVLVIAAGEPDDPDVRRQDQAVAADLAGLKARDVVVIHAGAADGGLRGAAGLPAGRFGVALVGKDGGVKLRSAEPVAAAALFRLIDAMPMRREEMRSGRSR